jgi:hypothetical protein
MMFINVIKFKQHLKSFITALIWVGLFLLMGCGSGKLSDQDLILNAQQAIDNQNFNDALNDLNQISNQNVEEVAYLRASANAGLAGFRAFQIYDIIYTNQSIIPPILLLFILSQQYSNTSINYSRDAISAIENFNMVIETRDPTLNISFALTEFYKVSQIVLQDSDLNHTGYFAANWNPCDDINFPVSDVREVIVALNKGILALNEVRKVIHNADIDLLFSLITEIQNDIGINTGILDEDAIQTTDLITFRTFINQTVLKNDNVCQ